MLVYQRVVSGKPCDDCVYDEEDCFQSVGTKSHMSLDLSTKIPAGSFVCTGPSIQPPYSYSIT